VRVCGCQSASSSSQSWEYSAQFSRWEDGLAGAEAVGEGVEADGFAAFRGGGTGRLLCVLPVGLVLFVGDYHLISFLGFGEAAHGATPLLI
jgi:hypothetical protein